MTRISQKNVQTTATTPLLSFFASIATIIAIRLWGDAGIAIATTALTVVILIFAEVLGLYGLIVALILATRQG